MQIDSYTLLELLCPMKNNSGERCELSGNSEVRIVRLGCKILSSLQVALKNQKLEKLDAQVNDFGCQLRAMTVYDIIAHPNLEAQCAELVAKSKTLFDLTNAYSSSILQKKDQHLEKIRAEVKRLVISEDLAYLLQAYFLRSIRKTVPNETSENYEIDVSFVDRYVKEIPEEVKLNLVNSVQARFSRVSIEFLRRKIVLPNPVMQKVVGDACLKLTQYKGPTGDVDRGIGNKYDRLYRPRAVVNTFYSMKIVLDRLRALNVPILVRKIVMESKKEASYGVLVRLGTNTCYTADEIKSLNKKTPVIVFESKIQLSLQELKEKLQGLNVYDLIMTCAAQSLPYDTEKDKWRQLKETQKDLSREDRLMILYKEAFKDVPEACEEVSRYLQLAPALECRYRKAPIIKLNHVYCATLGEEYDNWKLEGNIA